MTLEIDVVDLRQMIKELCDTLITDERLSNMLYHYIIRIEDDERFRVMED